MVLVLVFLIWLIGGFIYVTYLGLGWLWALSTPHDRLFLLTFPGIALAVFAVWLWVDDARYRALRDLERALREAGGPR